MEDIKQKTKIGMVWNALEKFSVQGISFVLNIILARLLTPHDYGVIGMLSIFIVLSTVFVESGFSRALIQKQNRTEIDFSTILIFNILISIFLYLVLFICSPAIAKFYKTPELIKLQRILFLVLIINSFTVVQNAKFQIQVDFKKIALINSLATIVSGVMAIIAAYKGLGAWALVIQTLSKSLFTAVVYWILGHWIPKTGFSFASFKSLFKYSSKLLASSLLYTTLNNINNLVIGKLYNPSNLGFFTRAQQFPNVTAGTLDSVLTNSTFPLMASQQNNHEELVNTFKKLIRLTAMIIFPAMTGLALLGKPLILVLLGEKWFPSVELLFWLSLSNIWLPLCSLNQNMLNSIGRSDVILKIDICKIPVTVITMIITFPISLKAIVIGQFIDYIIFFLMNSFAVGQLFHFGSFKQLLCSVKYILSTLVMAAAVIAIDYFLTSNLLSLLLGILGGVIVYCLILFILKDDEFFNMLRKILKRI